MGIFGRRQDKSRSGTMPVTETAAGRAQPAPGAPLRGTVPEQAARYEADAWEENIAAYLKTRDRVTVGGVAREALHIETPRIGTSEQRRIAAALETLHWRRELPDGKTDSQGKRWWPVTARRNTPIRSRPIRATRSGRCWSALKGLPICIS